MRYIILLFALTLSIAKASAQDVLNEVLRTSDAIINDTTKAWTSAVQPSSSLTQ